MKLKLSVIQSLLVIGRAVKDIYDEGKSIYRDVKGDPVDDIEEGEIIDEDEEED